MLDKEQNLASKHLYQYLAKVDSSLMPCGSLCLDFFYTDLHKMFQFTLFLFMCLTGTKLSTKNLSQIFHDSLVCQAHVIQICFFVPVLHCGLFNIKNTVICTTSVFTKHSDRPIEASGKSAASFTPS